MQVSKLGRFVYINPPRTGTTSIWRAAERSFKDLWQPSSDFERCPDLQTSCSYLGRHKSIWKDEWEEFFIFITVRHPYSRAVSMWHRMTDNLQTRPPELQKLLKYGKISFADMVCHESPFFIDVFRNHACFNFVKNIPRVDHIVHLETFAKDIETLNQAVPKFRIQPSSRANASISAKARIPWHKHYNEKAISLVAEAFSEDFDNYGYNKNFDQTWQGKVFA